MKSFTFTQTLAASVSVNLPVCFTIALPLRLCTASVPVLLLIARSRTGVARTGRRRAAAWQPPQRHGALRAR